MCLICVEYNKKRMTKEEMNKALPEMVMFAKTEEERAHFKELQAAKSEEELEDITKTHASQMIQKNEYKSSKIRRS